MASPAHGAMSDRPWVYTLISSGFTRRQDSKKPLASLGINNKGSRQRLLGTQHHKNKGTNSGYVFTGPSRGLRWPPPPRDPGRHTHTHKAPVGRTRTTQREFHQGTAKNPAATAKDFQRRKTGRTKPSRGNSTRGPPKTRSNSKRFSRTKNPSTQKTTQREFHQGTAKNPAATAKDFQRRKNPSTHQGIA